MKNTIIPIAIILVIYGAICFINLQANPLLWDKNSRIVFVIFTILVALFYNIPSDTTDDNHFEGI